MSRPYRMLRCPLPASACVLPLWLSVCVRMFHLCLIVLASLVYLACVLFFLFATSSFSLYKRSSLRFVPRGVFPGFWTLIRLFVLSDCVPVHRPQKDTQCFSESPLWVHTFCVLLLSDNIRRHYGHTSDSVRWLAEDTKACWRVHIKRVLKWRYKWHWHWNIGLKKH